MSARDQILDSAAKVILERGIVGATTKEIAREAGYSEANLYKHFADKQDIFLAVLQERVPALDSPADLAGSGTVAGNLRLLTAQLIGFYERSFPMAVSIMSAPALLSQWREGLAMKGGGPTGPLQLIENYVDAEIRSGRLPSTTDAQAIAALLCGAAMQQVFLAVFAGRARVTGTRRLVAALVDSLSLAH